MPCNTKSAKSQCTYRQRGTEQVSPIPAESHTAQHMLFSAKELLALVVRQFVPMLDVGAREYH